MSALERPRLVVVGAPAIGAAAVLPQREIHREGDAAARRGAGEERHRLYDAHSAGDGEENMQYKYLGTSSPSF